MAFVGRADIRLPGVLKSICIQNHDPSVSNVSLSINMRNENEMTSRTISGPVEIVKQEAFLLNDNARLPFDDAHRLLPWEFLRCVFPLRVSLHERGRIPLRSHHDTVIGEGPKVSLVGQSEKT